MRSAIVARRSARSSPRYARSPAESVQIHAPGHAVDHVRMLESARIGAHVGPGPPECFFDRNLAVVIRVRPLSVDAEVHFPPGEHRVMSIRILVGKFALG